MDIQTTDEELATRSLQKDTAAFSALYERYFDKAYDLVVRMVGNSGEAADIVQDAFLKLLQFRGAPPANFRAWFYTVVRHQAIDAVRKGHGTVPLPTTETDEGEELPLQVVEPGPEPAETARNQEVVSLVWEAARGLSADEYTILDLHVRKGLETEELAQALNTSKGNVYTMLSRLKDSFEESLTALIIARQGKKECPVLSSLVSGGKTPAGGIDRSLRRKVTRHVRECATCQTIRRRYVSAAALLSALPPILPAPAMRQQVLERLLANFGPPGHPTGPAGETISSESGSPSAPVDRYAETRQFKPEGVLPSPASHPQTSQFQRGGSGVSPSESTPTVPPTRRAASEGRAASGGTGMPPGRTTLDQGSSSFFRGAGVWLRRHWKSVTLILGLAAVVATLVSIVIPLGWPGLYKIVFHRYIDGNYQIFIMKEDGTQVTQLTKNNVGNNVGNNMNPHTNAAGMIAFASDRDGNWEIYRMYQNGAYQTRMTNHPAWDGWPNYSQDGARIVFASNRDGNVEIYDMNVQNAAATRLTYHPAIDTEPHYSYDGKKIVFTSDRDGNPEIYVMNKDGSNQTRLTYNAFDDHHPSWTPNGQILFTSNRLDGNYELYRMPPVPNASATRLTNNGAMDETARTSPDGSKIAFISNRDGNPEVYKMYSTGASPQRLTNYIPVDGHPDWTGRMSVIPISPTLVFPTVTPIRPTPTPTPIPPVPPPTISPTPVPTPTIIPTATPTPPPTPPQTPPRPDPTPLTPSPSPSPTPTPSPSPPPTPTPTAGPAEEDSGGGR